MTDPCLMAPIGIKTPYGGIHIINNVYAYPFFKERTAKEAVAQIPGSWFAWIETKEFLL